MAKLQKNQLLIVAWLPVVVAIDYTNSLAELRSVLLKNYVPKIRPHDEGTSQLSINVALRPRYLEKLVESEERATLLLNIDLYWNDSRLTWDSEEYMLHSCIYLQYSEIWTPDFCFLDAIIEECNLSPKFSIHLCSQGQIHLEYHCRVTVIAKFHAETFPFDRQHIEIRYGHPSIGMEDLDLNPLHLNISDMQQVDDWFFRGYQCSKNVTGPTEVDLYLHKNHVSIVCKVFVERNPSHIVINFCIPATIVAYLAVTGIHFSSGSARASRYQVGLVALMSISVLSLQIVADLPHSKILKIHKFYFGLIGIIVCSCIACGLLGLPGKCLLEGEQGRRTKLGKQANWISLLLHLLSLMILIFWFLLL